MNYVTRIAPSPTGDMHIGTARTAYHNWLAARASGGKFILRIDDTDTARNNPQSVKVIFETMDWLGLNYDQMFRQSERFERYRKAIDELKFGVSQVDGALVFNYIDVETCPGLPRTWHDEVAGDVKITDDDLERMQGMVLIRSDGTPTYNWASVVDDMDMGVNYILRGTDHITNTSRQVVLFHLLGATIPKFAHVGLIGIKGKPLSKRDGAASMLHYRNVGYDPDAMLNFLVRLGWGPKVDDATTKMLPRERMLELFLTGGNLKNNLANLDMVKLEAYDRKYKAAKKVWRNKDVLMDHGDAQ